MRTFVHMYACYQFGYEYDVRESDCTMRTHLTPRHVRKGEGWFMIDDNGYRRGDDGVEVHCTGTPDDGWRIDWFQRTVPMFDPEAGRVTQIKSSPVLRPSDVGWPDRSFRSVDEAYEYAAPLIRSLLG
jgi:hypothetical protein